MADPEHLELIMHGVYLWNKWREEYPGIEPDLSEATLSESSLEGVNLSEADLRGVKLSNSDLSRANLSAANLSGAGMRGVDLCGADLCIANLSGAELTLAQLNGANLSGADMRWATLSVTASVMLGVSVEYFGGADLRNANLSGAKLNRADLKGVNFGDANLSNADLTGAKLTKANLSRTNISNAIFNRAVINYTTFDCVDLSAAKALDQVIHIGPSTIGIDTLYRSGGRIPEVFLRGVGMKESLVEIISQMVARENGREFCSCFIMHDLKDKEFANKLNAALHLNGINCYLVSYDERDDGPGKNPDQIICSTDRVLLVLSDNSMSSDWLKDEIGGVRRQEMSQGVQLLYPISLVDFEKLKMWKHIDENTGRDLALDIIDYYIHDFARWEDKGSYAEALKVLLQDF